MGKRIDGTSIVMESFDVTILGEDLHITSEKLEFATLGQGSHLGIQHCLQHDTQEEKALTEHLDAIRDHFVAVNKIINKDLYETIL